MKRILILVSSFCALYAQATTLPIEQWQTSKGSKVLFFKNTDLPMVDISIAFKAGSAFDKRQWGLATLTANLIDQGTMALTATQIAEKFENYGAVFSANVDKDKTTFSLRSLTYKESLTPVLETLKQLLTTPSFPPQTIQREKQNLLTTINYMNEKPSSVANHAFYQSLYGKHPYGHSTFGTKSTLTKIKRPHIQAFFKEHYTAHNATIALVGNLTSEEAVKISNALSEGLNSSRLTMTIPVLSRAQTSHSEAIHFPSNQTSILIGQVGIDHKNPYYFPLMVGNYTLGGSGLISQLAKEVRAKRGLTYGVYSNFKTLEVPGPFTISLATKSSKTKEALQVTQKTLFNFLAKGPSAQELNAAKQYLIGSFPLKLSSNASIVGTLLNMGFYDLPTDYIDTYLDNINKVTLDDIQKAFSQTINPNALTTITVGEHG